MLPDPGAHAPGCMLPAAPQARRRVQLELCSIRTCQTLSGKRSENPKGEAEDCRSAATHSKSVFRSLLLLARSHAG